MSGFVIVCCAVTIFCTLHNSDAGNYSSSLKRPYTTQSAVRNDLVERVYYYIMVNKVVKY